MNETNVDTHERVSSTIQHAVVESFVSAKGQGRKRQKALVQQTITDENGFFSLRNEWNALVDRSPVHIYQTFDWQWFWWKHYGGSNTLFIITLRAGNKLVGIMPLFTQAYELFGITLYKRLRMIGCGVDSKDNNGLPSEYGPSDYLDVIVIPEYANDLAEAFIGIITSEEHVCDEVQFSNTHQHSLLRHYIIPLLESNKIRYTMRENDLCPYLSVPQSSENFFNQLSPSTRHRIRQAKKEFECHPPFSIESITHRINFRNALNDLVYFHQHRWNALGYAGLFSDKRFCDFQHDVLHAFFEQGLVWFKAVRFNGIRTAARLGFCYKSRMYDYLSGFDETLPGSKKRPSLALLNSMIEDAIEQGIEVVDFLRGSEPYKLELTHESYHNSEIQIFSSTGFSFYRMLYRLFHTAGYLLRRCADEWKLLTIQRNVHGNVKFLFSYIKFVFGRLNKKIVKPVSAM